MDRSHASYQSLRMGRRDIVQIYISHLKALYKEHGIWKRAEHLTGKVLTAPAKSIENKYFRKCDNPDIETIRYMRAVENFAGSPPPNWLYTWYPLLEQTGRAITHWKPRL